MNSKQLILEQREIFNLALIRKDAETIRGLLAPSYHIVTGRSAQNHGAEAETQRWAELFREDPSAVYRRTPREVTINEEWGLTEELGNWQGSYTAEGTLLRASGVYAAKWQRTINGNWVLQIEVFTTLTCSGLESGCLKPDPIPDFQKSNAHS
ncbi:MAG: nuclear transport factor 2 family protein [Chloroflexi bacterium]|nr:nuclear transport factor 2 family protein [Chloroflexota bacterium]